MIKKISVFDLDRTLLTINSSFLFCFYLYRKKVLALSDVALSIWYYFFHSWGFLSLEELHKKVFSNMLSGLSEPLLAGLAESFVDQTVSRFLYFPSWQRLQRALHTGEYVVIFSAGPRFLVSRIAKKLGANEVESSEYVLDKSGNFLQIRRVLGGKEKAGCLAKLQERLGVLREDCTGYSDSHHDLPLLLAVGNAVMVRPDRKLFSAAQPDWEEI